mmetsp:Transcript_12420/g.37357  ORF Transcript_12420/g.37357 Transcript_12420/m.37357 type:complete len:482 (+) Transcript_12420:144-1589(+)
MGFLSHKRTGDEAAPLEEQPPKGTAGMDQKHQNAAVAGGASGAPAPGMAVSETAATSTQPMNDILLQVPAAEVHQVADKKEHLLAQGQLVAYGVVYPTGESRMALEVGEARWWLLPDTAALKVAPLSYMFSLPDNKTFYCVTFAEDTQPEAVGAFEGLVEEVCAYQKSEALLSDPEVAAADFGIAQGLQGIKFDNRLANSISSGGARVASGILLAAAGAADKVVAHGQKMQAASPATTTPHAVPGVVKSGAATVRSGTKLVSKAAGHVVNAVASVPVFIVDKLTRSKPPAPGEPLKPQSAKSQMLTASAVSFTMVYEAMESSAKLVLNGTRTSAAGVVTHKYGPDAGKLTDDTLASGGHAFNAYTSYRNIAVKAIAKKTAKTTAKRMLSNYVGSKAQEQPDYKGDARAQVKQHAKSMRRTHTSGAASTPGSAAGTPKTQHDHMLEAHKSRPSLTATSGAGASAATAAAETDRAAPASPAKQ